MSGSPAPQVARNATAAGASIRVSLLLFASVAEATGARRREVRAPEGSTARGVFELLAADVPALAGRADHVSYARNQQFVPPDTVLADGDELAVIPPVSGGA
ncbi:MAG: MoaD/ThiS family protein [Chloroflexota bacterium]|nr:MoaD/ThiS family protein [Chloroflexota bacterium]